MNELIFLFHSLFVAFAALGAAYLAREALATFVAITFVLANLFVIKQITLFGLNVTAADSYMVGSVLALNLLNEYFGQKSARKALWIAFAVGVLVMLLAQMHLLYLPNIFDTSQEHFVAIFAATPRIIAASLFSYFVSQRFENYLYTFLKHRFNGKYLVARNYISMSCSQLLDTVLFSVLGLYGIVASVSDIMIVSYSVKLLAIALVSPLMWLSTLYMKKMATQNDN